jgi:ABC-2 type transport system permease protein
MFRLLQELRFRRNGIIGWGLGVSMLPLMYLSIYPQFAEQMGAFEELMDLAIYQAMGISMAGFEGFAASTVINIAPVIVGIYAILNSTGTLAGEEDNGRLELIVTLPVPRWQIVATKVIATGIALFLILLIVGLISAGTMAVFLSQIETAVTPVGFLIGILSAWPLVMATAMIGFFFGAVTPSRRIAALLTTAVFLVSYFGNNLAGLVTSLETIQPFFPHYYFDATAEVLIKGPHAGDVLILLAVALIFFLLAVLFFQWRNLTVHAWPWQRGKLPA